MPKTWMGLSCSLGLAGCHLQSPYREGAAMFLCTVWNRVSIRFRRNYMLVKGNQEGEITTALWKQRQIRIYGNNFLLWYRVIPQSGGQTGSACCIGQTIN